MLTTAILFTTAAWTCARLIERVTRPGKTGNVTMSVMLSGLRILGFTAGIVICDVHNTVPLLVLSTVTTFVATQTIVWCATSRRPSSF